MEIETRPNLEERKVEERVLKEIYDSIHIHKSGLVSLDAHQGGKDQFGLFHHPKKEKYLIEAFKNNNGISFEVFSEWARKREEVLLKMFDHVDETHDGHITTEEMQHYYKTVYNKVLSVDQAKRIVVAMDIDKNGTIEYEEFFKAAFLVGESEDVVAHEWMACASSGVPVGSVTSMGYFF